MAVKQISIQREYEKNPDIKPEDIKKLRDWLGTQPHLPGDLLSDVDLLIAYHCCDKSIEITKQLIDLHYTARTLFDVFFKDRIINRSAELAVNTVLIFPLETLTVQGYVAVYLRLFDTDVKNFQFTEVVKTFMCIIDLWQYENGSCTGAVAVIDMEGVTLGHIPKIDISALRKALYFVQECMLIKIIEVHFMNAPSFIDKVMLMIRPFLKKYLLDIIRIHPVGTDSVFESVPKRALPKNYGGESKDAETIKNDTLSLLKANKEYFEFESKRRVNEKLRPGKPSAIETVFGIQGSFKKLDID